MNRQNIFWIFLAGVCLAAESPSVNELGHFDANLDSPLVLNTDGPKRQLGEFTGSLSAFDEVSGRLSVRGAGGQIKVFLLDTNTPISDHHLQISSADLRLGDQLAVRYNVELQRVNSIERI